MSVTKLARRGLAVAAGCTTGLALVAAALAPAAQAAAARPAAPASLHKTGSINLGSLPSSFADDFSQAPSGAVYYSSGSTIYVVEGLTKSTKRTVSGTVLAVAANSSDLFVLVKRTVTEYRLSGGSARRHWALSGAKPTSGGLYVVGGRVYAWTDPATDESGFEYATLFRFSTSSSSVHRVSNSNVYPADMAANSRGLYYEAVTKTESNVLAHVTPSGSVHRVSSRNFDAPLALSGGRVELLAEHFGSHPGTYLAAYRQSNLSRVFSRHVSGSDRDLAGSGIGLLVLSSPCNSGLCSSSRVSLLRSSTGGVRSSVSASDGVVLVPGSSAVVIRHYGGDYHLTRLAS